MRVTFRLGYRRLVAGWVLAVVGPPLLTYLLTHVRDHFRSASDLLFFLTLTVAVALVGGLWPAVFAAVAGFLLVNWFFTPPLHTLTVAEPGNALALLLFVAVAVAVAAVVHLAVRRSAQAARARDAATALSLLATRLAAKAAQARALEEANKIRTALLAAVSHDLRTPLASIKASVSSLRATDVQWDPADEAELLATIEESADGLDVLVSNLLDMSRLSSGALNPLVRPVAIEEILEPALRGVAIQNVTTDIPEGLPPVVVDAGLVERAVANVVENAERHAGEKPVLITAAAHDGTVELRVADHGPGVAGADRERIFLPFQRLGDVPRGSGVGLGLAVARGFTEAVGGSLHAENTPGGGLTMVFALPVTGSKGNGAE